MGPTVGFIEGISSMCIATRIWTTNHHARSQRRTSQDAQASPLETGLRTIDRQTKAERQTQAGGVQHRDEEEPCLHVVDLVGHKVTLYLTSL